MPSTDHAIQPSQTTPSLLTRVGRAFRYAIKRFPLGLWRYPWIVAFLIVYAVARVLLNRSMGASWANALRPLALSLLFNALSIIIIDTLYHLCPAEPPLESRVGKRTERYPTARLVVLLLVWGFWALDIVDGLQTQGAIRGTPILSALPGWREFNDALLALGNKAHLTLPSISTDAWAALASNLVLRVLVPGAALRALGMQWRDMGLTLRRWWIAAPFVGIGLGVYLTGGLAFDRLLRMGVVLLYPGLTEELFYRGWLQRSLKHYIRRGNAVLITAVLFGLLHLPEFLAVHYTGMLPLALTNIGDVILTGLVWGYGMTRTRSVLPWAAVHAASNLAGL